MNEDRSQTTRLLKAVHAGDQAAAERLLPLVYAELHRVANAYMRRERPDHTLQPTALINEAYLRLIQEDVDWNSREHFIGFAAHVMRRVLVDYARARNADQRGGKRERVELRYFGGLSIEQIGATLGIAPRSVKRDWALARIWLFEELKPHGGVAGSAAHG